MRIFGQPRLSLLVAAFGGEGHYKIFRCGPTPPQGVASSDAGMIGFARFFCGIDVHSTCRHRGAADGDSVFESVVSRAISCNHEIKMSDVTDPTIDRDMIGCPGKGIENHPELARQIVGLDLNRPAVNVHRVIGLEVDNPVAGKARAWVNAENTDSAGC